MSVWGGWNQKGAKDELKGFIVENTNNIFQFLAGATLLYSAVMLWVPEDIFSSALFWDNLGLNIVFSDPSYLTTTWPWPRLPDMSTNAIGFGVFLFVLQLMLGYTQANAGPWTKQSNNFGQLLFNMTIGKVKTDQRGRTVREKEHVEASTLSWSKVGYTLAWISIAVIDTLTDVDFRAFGNGNYWTAIWTSTLMYNLGSEIALIYGGRYSVGYGALLITNFFQSKKPKSAHQKNSGKPHVPAGAGGHSAPNHGGRNNQQGHRGNQNGGGNRNNNRGNHQRREQPIPVHNQQQVRHNNGPRIEPERRELWEE